MNKLWIKLLLIVVVAACAVPGLAVISNFPTSLTRMLVHEGGWNFCDKRDPGGCTLNGITQARWYAYLRDEGRERVPLSPSMLKTKQWRTDLEVMYERYYATPCGFHHIPKGLDYVVFDYCVNSGVTRGGRSLRCTLVPGMTMRECMGVMRTWTIDEKIIEAVNNHPPRVLMRAICAEREGFLRGLHTFPVYGGGWMRRLRSVCAVGPLMFEGRTGSANAIRPGYGPGRAFDEIGLEEEQKL